MIALLLFAEKCMCRSACGSIFCGNICLGMSTCEQALDVLIGATCGLKIDELLDLIMRRNVMEALGRSKDQRALPAFISVLTCAEAVFNAILALIRIGWFPDKNGEILFLSLLDGDNMQCNAVVQACTRPGTKSEESRSKFAKLGCHEIPLASFAPRACLSGFMGKLA